MQNIFGLLVAQAATTADPNAGGGLVQMLILFGAMGAIFYFFLIRPQRKKDKEIQKLRSSITVGDEITTIGGIVGKIVSIKDDTMVIESSADRSKIKMMRWAIQTKNVTPEE